ncbi:unnamed protein product [Mycena citricolor]|uniref:Phytase-like domain-containing protein n=1 Tax=Mycena citricolor TaxID=2018698 RepID=A0AAD2JX66_9AGAR|nr:unnamed protein product [Mycena citricolor]
MLTKLLTVTLGALSFVTDSAVPSWDNQPQNPQTLSGLHRPQEGPNVQPTPGTYRIVTPNYGYAEIRTYRIGEALYVSRTREYSGPYGSFELMQMDDTGNVFGLKNVGQGSSIVIDGDNKFVTTTDDYMPQGFTMERTETEGFFMIRTTDGTDRVWTLNPEEGPMTQRIMLAPASDDSEEANLDQRFRLVSPDSDDAPRVVAPSAKFAHKHKSSSPISPGRYLIHDSLAHGMLRSYNAGQDAFTSISREYPGAFGVWSVEGDDKSGYTITNVGLNLPLRVTHSNTLATKLGAKGSKFMFVKRGDNGRIGVELMDGKGVWHLDDSQGLGHSVIQINRKDPNSKMQEFEFVSIDN